ncbi:MAG: DUF1648 domain-containing protein, partial [Nonomuraea sp.]|nr:DUF1648 domain-containing protein [Nonomuraea sp.]
MNPRAASAVWGAAVAAALVVVPLSLRERLPDPMATHWSGGDVPDGSMSFAGDVLTSLGLWAVLCVPHIAIAVHGRALARRKSRAFWWGGLFGTGLFVLGVEVTTLMANLDAPDWTLARMPMWWVPLLLLGSGAVGVLAGYLGRGEPDPVSEEARPTPA